MGEATGSIWKRLFGRRSGDAAGESPRRRLGRRAEQAAARHLKRRGYRILARNLRSRLGEIDLLAESTEDRTIVVVEVKAAAGEDPPPEVHVDARKQRKLTALADQLVRRHRLDDRRIRFDVIAVVWPADCKKPTRLTHHVNAFPANV